MSGHYLGTLADLCGDRLSEELAPALETTARLLHDSASVRRFRDRRGKSFTDERGVWPDLCKLGLVSICAPERAGGSALPPGAGVLIAEAVGRHLAPEPYIAGAFLPTLFLAGCESDEADRLLQQAGSGDALPVVALQETPGLPNAEVETVVLDGETGLRLCGRKRFVHAAAWATHFLVAVKRDAGLCLAAVRRDAPGVRLNERMLADGTSSAELVFTDVDLPEDAVLASDNRAIAILEHVACWAQVAISAELFGNATALFAMTIDYLKVRRQFDELIGSFQALQHRAVDLYCHKEIARFAIAEAITAIAAGDGPIGLAASRCKARAADAAMRIARESVQLHGAIGFSDEADVGLYLRRIMSLAAWMGGADAHHRAYAQASPLPGER